MAAAFQPFLAGLFAKPVHLDIGRAPQGKVRVSVHLSLGERVRRVCISGILGELGIDLAREEADAEALTSSCADKLACSPVLTSWRRPYCYRIAENIEMWSRTGAHPFEALPPIDGLEEVSKIEQVADGECMHLMDRLPESLDEVIASLGPWGMLRLLGIRRTRLSLARAPPSIGQLVRSFNTPHNSALQLSAGARALTKHWHRAPSDQRFWISSLKGGDAEKNDVAEAVLMRILKGAVWANCHCLPGSQEAVYELRLPNGYGARWSADGSSFRGFLEPQAWDESRWQHARTVMSERVT